MSEVTLQVGPPAPPDVEELDPSDLELDVGAEEPAPAPVTDVQVRGMLKGIGGVLHQLLGDDDVPAHWEFTDEELAVLTPAIVRMAARRPKLARAIERGDELFVAVTIAAYAGRNVEDATKARKARARQQGEDWGAETGPHTMARPSDEPSVGGGGYRGGVPAPPG